MAVRYRSLADADGIAFKWESSLNKILTAGNYAVEIEHYGADVGLPIEDCGTEHSIVGTLVVTDSGALGNKQGDRVMGQVLTFTLRENKETSIYTRTYAGGEWGEWCSLARTGMYDEITNADELYSTVSSLVSTTKELKDNLVYGIKQVVDAGKVQISTTNENGGEKDILNIMAATSEKAGVMTAEDKKIVAAEPLTNAVLKYRDVGIEYTGTDADSVLKDALKLLRIETDNPDVNAVDFRVTTLMKNHTNPVYRFGLGASNGLNLWVYGNENILDGNIHSEEFFLYINGLKYKYTVFFAVDGSAIDKDGIIISHRYGGSPYRVTKDAVLYMGDIEELQTAIADEKERATAVEIELQGNINNVINDVSGIKVDIAGSGGLNFLKEPNAAYNETDKLIISAIKNIGFYDVPYAIKDDDIFVRSFSAQSTVGGGTFGQLIYIANKRIYNETSDWGAASIQVAPLEVCDYQEHEFDVTVSSGEMKGLRIRVLIDYSVFAGTEFIYGTSINNKIVFNLNRTWNIPIVERVEDLEQEVEGNRVDSNVIPMEQRNVAWLGSSNVWGDGFLFYSYLKAPIEWLYKSTGVFTSANDVVADNGEVVRNSQKFLGDAVKIQGVGSAISFTHRGSELNICQVIERSSEYAVIGLYDGTEKVAEFTNHNNTIGNDNVSFTGDGSHTKFNLDRCLTYNHVLTVNGVAKSIALNTQGYGASFPDGVDCLVIRAVDAENAKVVHSLWFKNAPANGAVINVSYDYGETICFVKSTVGEDADGVNESPYGDGTISYDPNNPATIGSGLDYRLVNEKAFFKHWFDDDKERCITLKIERGSTNPYFTFNFASSVFHNVMNAGIGGYTAAKFNTTEKNPLTSWVNIADYFTPDFVSIGLTGNDDFLNFPRKISRLVNMSLAELREYPSLEIGKIEYVAASDTYDVTVNSGTITEITARSLKSPSIVGSGVVEGDFVRIGTYTGDLRQVQTRRVESVDTVNGVVTWAEPLHLNEFVCINSLQDLVGQDVSIRSIEQYMTNMVQLVKNILSINPKCKVCLFNVYYVDMLMRNTAEYTYIQQWIASEFPSNVFVVDAWRYSRDYVECAKKSRTISASVNENGEVAFSSPSSHGHWEGIEVWVGDRNVYGTDCYAVTGYKYTVDPAKSGAALNWEGTDAYLRPYTQNGQMKIKWKKNIPAAGTAVTIKLAYRQWSSDWGHPGAGDYIDNSLGRAMIYALKR